MYTTFWDLYSFTALPRQIGIVRISRHNYDKLRVIAACQYCRSLLTHASIIEIGAGPAKVLMILANIPQEAWNAVGDQVVFLRSATALKLADSLLMVTTALMQECCDKLALHLHIFGAWI